MVKIHRMIKKFILNHIRVDSNLDQNSKIRIRIKITRNTILLRGAGVLGRQSLTGFILFQKMACSII